MDAGTVDGWISLPDINHAAKSLVDFTWKGGRYLIVSETEACYGYAISRKNNIMKRYCITMDIGGQVLNAMVENDKLENIPFFHENNAVLRLNTAFDGNGLSQQQMLQIVRGIAKNIAPLIARELELRTPK